MAEVIKDLESYLAGNPLPSALDAGLGTEYWTVVPRREFGEHDIVLNEDLVEDWDPALEDLAPLPVTLDALRKKPGRTEFQRGIATLDENGRWQVGKTGKQGSGILTSMSRANCFIVLPDDSDGVEPGDDVSIQFMDWSA